MNTLAIEMHPLAQDVQCSEDSLTVTLLDGRVISAPLSWFPRLSRATSEQKSKWEILGDGEGIHWPEIDEDLSVSGLLQGTH